MEAEIQVRNCDVPLLKCCLERLLQLFECLAKVEEGPDCLHLKLWTHKTDDTLRCAQEFLLSVTSENPAFEKQQPLSTEALSQLFSLRSEIERDARVLLTFSDGEVIIRGPQANVHLAMQLVDEFLTHGVVLSGVIKHSLTADSLLSEPIGANGRKDGRLTRRVESEDSSYDSDTESGLGPGTRSQGSTLQHKMHDDVSRTVSDTLGAEFAEYVSTHKVELKTVLADPSYQTRLEFAVKLGYTEAQVQNALQRLGLSASNNELLAELIKLSSTAKPVSLDGGAGVAAALTAAAAAGAATGAGASSLSSSLSLSSLSSASAAASADVGRGGELRPIVIDGSNVAMSHGNKEVFSCRGIKICVDYFRARGHKEITVFVPSWRKEAPRPNTPIANQELLLQLEREKVLVFTPSRNVGGKRLVCYEDRYILRLAAETDGIVVSNDNYRDLVQENSEFKKVVEERLLMYTVVNDRFMPPDDPLGRTGPTLDQFLMKPSTVPQQLPPVCPYAKKCTYGNKCKYYHPERGNKPQKSITEKLAEQAKIQLQEVKARGNLGNEVTRTRSVPVTSAGDLSVPTGTKKKQPVGRTRSAAPAQRLQDDFPMHGTAFASDVLWRHQSWSNLPKTMLSESGHLSLAKKLSDPDSHCETNDPGPGLHKKLQRQLTLNPNHDERLEQMKLVNAQPSRAGSNSHHNNVARLSSDGFRATQKDAYKDGWQAGGLSGQNSTSDTKLNMFPNQFVTPTCYQANIWSPLPSQQNVRSPIPSQQNVRPSSVPPQNRMRAPLSVPPVPAPAPTSTSASFGSGAPLPSVNTFDERHKLYYHLTSIFPEEQVKMAMESQPDELNPQKICAAILSMFPPKP